jgi:hypothetical protein
MLKVVSGFSEEGRHTIELVRIGTDAEQTAQQVLRLTAALLLLLHCCFTTAIGTDAEQTAKQVYCCFTAGLLYCSLRTHTAIYVSSY